MGETKEIRIKVGKYLFDEYRELTTNYVAISKRLRNLLPRMTRLSEEEGLPARKVIRGLMEEFDETEGEIEAALSKFRNIRHGLVAMLLRSRKD